MRTTITLDDELVAEAQRATGLTERSAVIREGLRALIEREAIEQLIALGGTDREAAAAPRRRLA